MLHCFCHWWQTRQTLRVMITWPYNCSDCHFCVWQFWTPDTTVQISNQLTHMHAHIQHICTVTPTYTPTDTHTYTHACMHTHTHMCTHMHPPTKAHACRHAHVSPPTQCMHSHNLISSLRTFLFLVRSFPRGVHSVAAVGKPCTPSMLQHRGTGQARHQWTPVWWQWAVGTAASGDCSLPLPVLYQCIGPCVLYWCLLFCC